MKKPSEWAIRCREHVASRLSRYRGHWYHHLRQRNQPPPPLPSEIRIGHKPGDPPWPSFQRFALLRRLYTLAIAPKNCLGEGPPVFNVPFTFLYTFRFHSLLFYIIPTRYVTGERTQENAVCLRSTFFFFRNIFSTYVRDDELFSRFD